MSRSCFSGATVATVMALALRASLLAPLLRRNTTRAVIAKNTMTPSVTIGCCFRGFISYCSRTSSGCRHLDQPGEEKVDVGCDRIFMGLMHGHSEYFVEKTVMDDHADEGASCQEWVDRSKYAVFNSRLNVCSEMVIEYFEMFAKEHFGEFVPFQRAE